MATCYRHPGRETGVSCSNCGRAICPDCMTTSPVGMRCPECAHQTTKVRTIRSSGHRGYEATLALIAINVIVFLAEGSGAYTLTGETSNSWLLNHGFLAAPELEIVHQYYRLVTSGFLHLDILHIASNMYVLYWVGRLLEPAIGRVRFVAIYFTGLLAGSLGMQIEAAVGAQEPAFIGKYAFQLAQAFNLFYHHHRVLTEEDVAKKIFLLQLSRLVEVQLVAALELLGIKSPEKM